jgi:hypothetical protein
LDWSALLRKGRFNFEAIVKLSINEHIDIRRHTFLLARKENLRKPASRFWEN